MLNQRTFSEATFDVQKDVAAGHPTHREAAYALLRLTIGVLFLSTGIVKFMLGISVFAAGLQQQFAGKLPMFLVAAFAYTLPFLEVLIGGLLVMGLFNVFALMLAGLLIIVLTFGKLVEGDGATVAHNLSYAIIIFVLLWLAEYNGYSLDRARRRR